MAARDMVLIIHGFPNRISALRFEWAWQNPKKSRRLRHLVGKRKNESLFQYCFRVVCEMLRTSPWNRLPLTVRWLKQEYKLEFEPQLEPPKHMPLQFGPVAPKQVTGSSSQTAQSESDLPEMSQSRRLCAVCHSRIQLVPLDQHFCTPPPLCDMTLDTTDNTVKCLVQSCTMVSHTLCLARSFLSCEGVSESQFLPVSGRCPICQQELLWGDIIRYKLGCYQSPGTQLLESDHWTDDLQT